MPPKPYPYKVKKEESEQPLKVSVRDSCSLRESRTSLLKQSIIVTGDTPFMPFKESNRSPDSFVRVTEPGKTGEQYQYARASIVQSEISKKSSIIDQNYLKPSESFHATQEQPKNQASEKKKNVEINLEKIIQIYNILDLTNTCQ